MKIIQNLVSSDKYSIKCPHSMTPQYITIHNTANDASAANEVAYMIRNDNKVSFHVAVDDVQAVQGVSFNRNAWHCGDGGTGTGNRKSIGIEICYSKSGGTRYDNAVKNAIELTAELMHRFNIPASKIVYHKHWNGKHCPHRLIDSGVDVETFRKSVQLRYDKLFKGDQTMQKDNTPDKYAKEAVEWAVKEGILNGDQNGNYMLHSNVTRQDLLVFLHNALKK